MTVARNNATVILFAYKRLDCLMRTVEALQKNTLAVDTDLVIFSDAAKHEKDITKVKSVRTFLHSISGFRQVVIHEASQNKGLARSIREGVSHVLSFSDKTIVLEDDLLTSPNFLDFMNKALEFYSNNSSVFSISGFSFPMGRQSMEADIYFHARGCSWGWGTWRNRWEAIDWELLFSKDKIDLTATRKMGDDFPSLVRKFKKGTVDSWAIPWCYHAFVHKLVTVYPTVSKVRNIGFDSDATHTSISHKRFNTRVDQTENTNFNFDADVNFKPYFTRRFLEKFSNFERLKWRVLNDLGKLVKT